MTQVLKNLGEPLTDDELQQALKIMEPDNEQQVRLARPPLRPADVPAQINLAFIVQKFLSNN